MRTPEQLLADHQPHLRYDSHEAYFAEAAETFTDSPGMVLKRQDGTVLATAGAGLSLDFLGHDPYPGPPDGIRPAKTDALSVPDRQYRERAAALHALPQYANVVYGHVATDSGGATWLQYWYWYLYNDYNLLGDLFHAGRHEGDWEMVQVRLDVAQRADLAVYAQHRDGEARTWDAVERLPGTERPVVYVARGSHAAYFSDGMHWTGVWFDHADGERPSPDRQRLVVTGDDAAGFGWLRWPGRWGDTPKHGGIAPADSPISPGTRGVWRDPSTLLDVALGVAQREIPPPPAPPPPPAAAVRWAPTGAVLDYTAPAQAAPPAALTVTVNSPDELRVPPRTRNVTVDLPAGSVPLPDLEPGKRYDVHVSTVTADGLASPSVRIDVPAAHGITAPPG
jgi:hypothetical protein